METNKIFERKEFLVNTQKQKEEKKIAINKIISFLLILIFAILIILTFINKGGGR